jgi:sugar-phosphatase
MPDVERLSSRVFDAVLFDMDGTLIDSTASVERSWAQWGRETGLDPSRWQLRHGVPARQLLADAVAPEEVDRAFARIEEIELVALDGIVVLPGAVEALRGLPPERLAIVTSSTAALAAARIEHTGLPLPAVVVTADDVPLGKPDPAPYLLAAQRLAVDPVRCLVVEDAPAGLASARGAGCTTLAVATTYSASELAADAVVGDLSDVWFETCSDGVRLREAGSPV